MRFAQMWVVVVTVGGLVGTAAATPATMSPLVVRIDVGASSRRVAEPPVARARIEIIPDGAAAPPVRPFALPRALSAAVSMIRVSGSSGALRISF